MTAPVRLPILGLFPEEVGAALGGPRYRGEQVFRWLHARGVHDFEAMSNLSRAVRRELAARFTITQLAVLGERRAADGSVKWLYGVDGGEAVEAVLMPAHGRRTLCLSTQVGCKFRCRFCASGLEGFTRHLRADEILAELRQAEQMSPHGPPSHLVVMGMGEPLDNDEQLLRALAVVTHPLGRPIGKRRITISTVGLPAKIRKLAAAGMTVELAVSLHSALDDVRSRLMPVNQAWPVAAVLKACWDYAERTRRQVTFEYLLLDGVNMDARNAAALVRALRGRPCTVNLIPYNPVPEYPWRRPSLPAIRAFQRGLRRGGLRVTVRFSKGGEVDAACGQLRVRHRREADAGCQRA